MLELRTDLECQSEQRAPLVFGLQVFRDQEKRDGLARRIGAWLTPQGCFFRVWAPHADRVSVLVQEGPYWEVDDIVIRQVSSNGDYWSGTVPRCPSVAALPVQDTTFRRGVIEHFDPAARDVLSSELTRPDPSSRNGSIVWEPIRSLGRRSRRPGLRTSSFTSATSAPSPAAATISTSPGRTFQDVESKLSYIRDMGFNCIEPLPVHEFALDRSWGYNPASFFAPNPPTAHHTT